MQLVGFSAVERISFEVLGCPWVLRAHADHLFRHGRGNAGGQEVEERSTIEIADARRDFELVAAEERQPPRAVRIEIGVFAADLEGDSRAVTAPILAASVRIFFIRSSGLNGFPFTI